MAEINCPLCEYEFCPTELPWTDDDEVDQCPSCDGAICIVPDITVRHKVALTRDEIDFVDAL